MKKKVKPSEVVDCIERATIDHGVIASPKRFFMYFEMGGSLTITIKDGKLVYKVTQ